MLAGKKLTDFTKMFSPNDVEKNDNMILTYFKDELYQRNWQNKLNWTDKIPIRWKK